MSYLDGLLHGLGLGAVLLFVAVILPGGAAMNPKEPELAPIERGAARAEIEKHFHFGLTSKSGYMPGGQMYEWSGKGWRVILQLAEQANHALPGHPV